MSPIYFTMKKIWCETDLVLDKFEIGSGKRQKSSYWSKLELRWWNIFRRLVVCPESWRRKRAKAGAPQIIANRWVFMDFTDFQNFCTFRPFRVWVFQVFLGFPCFPMAVLFSYEILLPFSKPSMSFSWSLHNSKNRTSWIVLGIGGAFYNKIQGISFL